MNDLEKLIMGNKPVMCEKCGGKMFYLGGGKYQCHNCGYEELDDFGKVKEFLDTYGPAPMNVIEKQTGVPQKILEILLRDGRVEISENSKYFIKCEKCGCSIRSGRFCPDCVRVLAGGIQMAFSSDMGEKPKKTNEGCDMTGKMHYFRGFRHSGKLF